MLHTLVALLHNRMDREGQVTPLYIGKFHGVDSLPKGTYPAAYFWEDLSAGCTRISFNTPLLKEWCVEEARGAGISASKDDESVMQAITLLAQVSSSAFQRALSQSINHYPEIIDEPFIPDDEPPEFNDPGDKVTDELLCAALDLMVWRDDEDSDLYRAKCAQVIDQHQAAEKVIMRFAEQMQPASHGQMLQEFIRITTCDRYNHSNIAVATVRATLNHGWHEIGPWRA